jgi:hypothetical protein
VYPPRHGSWLNQVELWFSALARRFPRRGDFAGVADFESRLGAFVAGDNARHGHAYRWTYAGEPLVRAAPWSRARRQQRPGRAWCGPRPPGWLRALYPPRPYNRRAR